MLLPSVGRAEMGLGKDGCMVEQEKEKISVRGG